MEDSRNTMTENEPTQPLKENPIEVNDEKDTQMNDTTLDNRENKTEEIQEETTNNREGLSDNNSINDEKEILMKKVEQLEQQLNELNDKHIRLLAEFDNFRKRTRKEKEDLIKYAGEEIWKTLLPILDDFERAIKENQNTSDIDTIKKGFELIFNKFKNITTKNHITAVDSLHKEFNPDYMEAVAKVPAPNEEMKGKVIDELEKAYQLNDKLIRHAKVVVGE